MRLRFAFGSGSIERYTKDYSSVVLSRGGIEFTTFLCLSGHFVLLST